MKPPRLRLSVRLALMIFLGQLALLGSFAVTVYFFTQRQFKESFDGALRASAQAIAAMVERNPASGAFELRIPSRWEKRMSRKNRPDLFAVWTQDGKLIGKAEALDELPRWAKDEDEDSSYKSFVHGEKRYRGVSIETVTDDPDLHVELRVFFAGSTHDMDRDLEDVWEFITASVGILVVASALLVWLLVWRGLAPMRELATQTRAITERDLDRRLDLSDTPPDLAPLAISVNELLSHLERAFEREKQFSMDAAHELRTPVSILKSGIQAAMLSPRSSREDQSAFEELLEDVTRLENLCESLLLMTTFQAQPGARLAYPAWIESLRGAVEDLRPLAESRGSVVVFSAAEATSPAGELQADGVTTRRVAMNLIENAIRHAGAGARIDVRAASNPAGATLIVEDNGPGIPPEAAGRVFERFFRVHGDRSRSTGGTGLGLAICHSLASALGGSLRYEPVPGGGSRFIWEAVCAPADEANPA